MLGKILIALKRDGVKEIILLSAIIALAAWIRFYHSFHIFISDEAFNLITIDTLASGGYPDYFFRHPPLYLLLSSLAYNLIGPYPQLPSFISIIFSVFSLIPFYLIVKDTLGIRVGLVASLFLAVMPSNIYYSTWMKQDGMLLFFFLWGVYFFLKGRYLLTGTMIGVAMLVKEFALFFFPLSLIMAYIRKDRNGLSGWLKMTTVSLFLSSWWYLLFGTSFYVIAGEAVTGGNLRELIWHFPWWSYIINAPHDFSLLILFYFLIGTTVLVREVYAKGFGDRAFFIWWVIVFYVPLSFMTVKTPWYIYLVTPAVAAIAAYGMSRLIGILRSKGYVLIGFTLIYLIFSVYSFSNVDYYRKVTGFSPPIAAKDTQGSTWDEMIEKRALWRREMKGVAGKVGFLEFAPILQYLMGISNDRVIILSVSSFMGLDREGLSKISKDLDTGAFVINADSLTYTERNLEDMRLLWGGPVKMGRLLLFKTR